MSGMKASLRTPPVRRLLLWAPVLAPVLALLVVGCGNGPRRLWLNSPSDGVLTIEDHEPPPY